MDFNTATDRATGACITLDDVAREIGNSSNLIRRARMSPDSDGYRRAPTNWPKAIAKLARKRAAKLLKLAEELEGLTGTVDPSS